MQLCIFCGKELQCTCGGGKPFGGAVVQCEVKKGALWVHVCGEGDGNIEGVPVKVGSKPEVKTDSNGVATFDPLDSETYDVTLGALPSPVSKTHLLPAAPDDVRRVPVSNGEISYAPFLLPRAPGILVVTIVDLDTGKAIPDVPFPILVTGNSAKSTELTGVARFELPPKAYDSVSVELTDPDHKLVYLPGAAEKATVTSGEETPVTLKVAVRKLKLVSVDHHFAPSVEDLEIKYEIAHLKTEKVLLRILDAKKETVYERELTEEEKTDSDALTIAWGKKYTDKGNQGGHGLDKQFLNPLYGPYSVVLFHSAPLQGQAPFHVLYHSITLDLLPWEDLYLAASKRSDTTKPGSSDPVIERMWLQYKLNELGFWAGPVDGTDSEELHRAIRCLYLAHPGLNTWKAGTPFYTSSLDPSVKEMVYDATADTPGLKHITPKLIDVLADGTTKKDFGRKFLSEPAAAADKSKVSKIYLDNHRFFFAQSTEFENVSEEAPTRKFNLERQWLNRPALPLRAKAQLLSKADAAADAPLATGPAPLLWKWQGLDEDGLRGAASAIAPKLPVRSKAEPSGTGVFVGLAQTGVWSTLGGPYKQQGTPVAAGGILTGTAADDAVVAFTACTVLDGAEYTPGTDGVFARTFTGDPKRTAFGGASVVYLRPSLIAGDNYQVTVSLNLDAERTRPGHDDRVLEHKARVDGLKCQSGRLVLWRRMAVNAYVGWPLRPDWNASLADVRKEFEPCFVELETSLLESGGTSYSIDQVYSRAELNMVLDIIGGNLDTTLNGIVRNRPTTSTIDKDCILSGDFEVLEPTQKFAPFVLKLCRLDESRGNNILKGVRDAYVSGAGDKPAAAKPVYALRAILEDWKTNAADGDVKSAAGTLATALDKWLNNPSPGTWEMKDPLDLPTFQSADFTTLPDIVLKAEHIDSLLVPKRVRDEVAAYVGAGNSTPPAATVTAEWIAWTTLAFAGMPGDATPLAQKRGTPLEYNFLEVFKAKFGAVLKSGAFLPGTVSGTRTGPLEIREWVARQAVGGLADQIKYPFSQSIDRTVRKKLADSGKPTDGLVLFDYLVAKPKTINGKSFTLDGAAFGGLNGAVLLDQGLITRFYSLVVHEIAHCAFLHHWRNTSPSIPQNHDSNDDNCLMSYPFPFKQSEYTRDKADSYLRWRFPRDILSPEKHYSWDTFTPHFCGKCNLQLRGWNIRAVGVPDNAPAVLPLVPKPPVKHVPIVRILTAAGKIGDSGDPSLGAANAIGISGYPAALAGSLSKPYSQFTFSDLAPFPPDFGDNPEAEKDTAAFRIEVEDLDTSAGSVLVTIEALKPVYASGRPTGAATEFPEPERSRRCLVGVECRMVSANLYRSRYIRLVTDEVDRIALNATKQGLLITDSADGLGGDNDLLEILDQQVRVTYDPTPV